MLEILNSYLWTRPAVSFDFPVELIFVDPKMEYIITEQMAGREWPDFVQFYHDPLRY